MILDTGSGFDRLLADFCLENALSELDRAILDHATDGWPMSSLAKQHGTTPNALHVRKKELYRQFREFLERRGITGSFYAFTV